MAPPNDGGPPLHGPINKSRRKADLEEIAVALGIKSNKRTGAERLAKAINTHLGNNPKLANEARFQGLFAYRSNNTGGGGKASQTSADKAAEDAAEAEKLTKDPTGAHKKLVDQNLPRDPPGRTTRLNRGATSAPIVDPARTGPAAVPIQQSGTSSGIDTETPGGTTPYKTVEDEEPGDAEELENSEAEHSVPVETVTPRGKDSVVVVLEHTGSLHSKPEIEEVHIPPDAGLTVEHRQVEGGQKAAFTKLSQLLPIALALASTPTKKKGGRLARTGATKHGSHVPLGSIEAILANPEASPSRYLKSTQVNSYRLARQNGDGHGDLLVCHLFVEPTDGGIKSMQPSNAPDSRATSSRPRSEAPSTGRSHGASSSSQSRNDKDGLVVYLRGLLDGPKGPWKKAKAVGDILPRVKAIEQAMERLEKLGWEQPKGGFLIPADYSDAEEFAGSKFIKEDVLAALQIGHSQAAGDAQLFKPEVMRKLPRLQAWYDKPDGDESAKFGKMRVNDFKEWQEEELNKLDRKRRKGKEKAKVGKKRARSVSSDGDQKGPKGGKKSKTTQYDTDELDESGSEESD